MTDAPTDPQADEAAPIEEAVAEAADASADTADEAGEGTGHAFAFGTRDKMRPISALPALDRMNERMARRLREAVFTLARMKPQIDADEARIETFEAWRSAQSEFTSLSVYRFRPFKGGLLIAIEPDLVGRLVDAYYGGSGAASPKRSKEFTATEERLLSRLTEALTATLTDLWSEVVPVQLQLTGRETNVAYATLVRGDEPVAITRFNVALGSNSKPSIIEIVYPCSSLRVVEAELASKVHDDGGVAGAEWRTRLTEAMGDVRVEARSVLARPTLSMLELLQLQPGDVIPITRPALVPLLIGGRTLAVGTIGEHDGRAALKIEKIERNQNRSAK